ncbi:hypothetical protein MHYP_G00102390 [Metynnis hypsauchen]
MEPDQSQALEWPRKRKLKRFKKYKREPAWELEEDLSKDQELEPSGEPNMRVSSSCNYHPRGATTKEVLGAIRGKQDTLKLSVAQAGHFHVKSLYMRYERARIEHHFLHGGRGVALL